MAQADLLVELLKSTSNGDQLAFRKAAEALAESLKTPANALRFREVMARYIGYGAIDIERVLACTEQRGTVLGCGEIREDQVHEYRFPLPLGLSKMRVWRRMVITLAWFSPINPGHRRACGIPFASLGHPATRLG